MRVLVLGVALLTAGVIASGMVIWRQHGEIHRLHEQIRASEARSRTRAEGMPAKEAEHLSPSGCVRAVGKSAEAATAVRDTVSASALPAVAARGEMDENSATDSLDQWLAEATAPEVIRRLNRGAQLKVTNRYRDLLPRLGLTPEQLDTFTRLLAEKRQVGVDVAAASLARGTDPRSDPAEVNDLIAATQHEIEAEIRAVIGERAYAEYRAFTLRTAQAGVLSRLEQTLARSAAPLTQPQAAQLQQLMEKHETGRISAKVVHDARGFLAPAQMEALQDLRRIQQANARKRQQPGQILPSDSAVAAGK